MSKRALSRDELTGFASHGWSLRAGWFIMVGAAGLLVVDLLAGCGLAGPPIAPEDIGIAAKVEEERREAQRLEGQDGEQERALVEPGARPPEEEAAQEDIILPPLRPIGTQ